MVQHSIQPFSPHHYPAYTRLWNAAYPDLKRTELEMRLADVSSPPSRWIAEQDGVVIGFGGYEAIDQGKFQLHLFVVPECRRRGVGSSLYDQVIGKLGDGTVLRAWAREDRPEGLRFLENRGFAGEMRTFHATLDTASFDLVRLEKYRSRLRKYGYQFRTFAELQSDPARNRKMYEVFCEVTRDIPSPEPRQLPAFEDYEERIINSPELFRAHFFALHNDRYVGLCMLLPQGRTKRELYADTLGIKRDYRGRGIAQALSYMGIEYAMKHGYAFISADSFVENQRINSLLENLGFGNRSVWTLFSKIIM